MYNSCPGLANIRRPTPEFSPCSKCSQEVEIWSDEYKAECQSCGMVVYREKSPSCIVWCEYAQECVGGERYRELMEREEEFTAWKESQKG